MKAMILAAGEGRRMRPLTDHTPKPLLQVGGMALLEHHIVNLRSAGFSELVVNAAYLGQQVHDFCGDGSRWGVQITVSMEPEPLETAGGIIQALPMLGESPFLVVNGDIWCPYPFGTLRDIGLPTGGAHLILVDNPAHNPAGDFALRPDGDELLLTDAAQLPSDHAPSLADSALGSNRLESAQDNPVLQSGVSAAPQGDSASAARRVEAAGVQMLTFSGIGVYHVGFFAGCPSGKRPLKPLLDRAIERGLASGSHWQGEWEDVGTPERLQALNQRLARQ